VPQPSTAPFTRDQTAGFSPFARVLAGSYSRDPSMANLTTGINLGRSATQGPGSDYVTQAEIAKARQLPITITSGETRIQNPAAAATGGAIQGPSNYTQTGETAGAGADDALAAKDLEIGAQAKADLGRLDLIDQLYDRLDALGANDPVEITKDLGVQSLSQKLGVDLSRYQTTAAMKAAIRGLAVGLTGTLRTTQGEPLPRGALTSIEALSPDPNAPPAQFHLMTGAIRNMEQAQANNFDAALKFRTDRPKLGEQAAITYHTQRGQNAGIEAQAHAALGPLDASSGELHVFPDQASAEAAIKSGLLQKGDRVRIGPKGSPTYTVGE
jgi:hypothetical protein